MSFPASHASAPDLICYVAAFTDLFVELSVFEIMPADSSQKSVIEDVQVLHVAFKDPSTLRTIRQYLLDSAVVDAYLRFQAVLLS